MSDTESPQSQSSDGQLSPILYISSANERSISSSNTFEALSQLDSQLDFPGGNRPKTYTDVQQRREIVNPSLKPRPPVPALTDEEVEKETLRILRKLPTELSMWTLMSSLEKNDLKTLCKYCGLKFKGGEPRKEDMGKKILSRLHRGDFDALKMRAENKGRPPSKKESGLATAAQQKDLSGGQVSGILPQPNKQVIEKSTGSTTVASNNVGSTIAPSTKSDSVVNTATVVASVAVPVISRSEPTMWKTADKALQALMREAQLPDESKETSKNQRTPVEINGVYIIEEDWRPCLPEDEEVLECANPHWRAKQILRALEKSSHKTTFRKVDIMKSAGINIGSDEREYLRTENALESRGLYATMPTKTPYNMQRMFRSDDADGDGKQNEQNDIGDGGYGVYRFRSKQGTMTQNYSAFKNFDIPYDPQSIRSPLPLRRTNTILPPAKAAAIATPAVGDTSIRKKRPLSPAFSSPAFNACTAVSDDVSTYPQSPDDSVDSRGYTGASPASSRSGGYVSGDSPSVCSDSCLFEDFRGYNQNRKSNSKESSSRGNSEGGFHRDDDTRDQKRFLTSAAINDRNRTLPVGIADLSGTMGSIECTDQRRAAAAAAMETALTSYMDDIRSSILPSWREAQLARLFAARVTISTQTEGAPFGSRVSGAAYSGGGDVGVFPSEAVQYRALKTCRDVLSRTPTTTGGGVGVGRRIKPEGGYYVRFSDDEGGGGGGAFGGATASSTSTAGRAGLPLRAMKLILFEDAKLGIKLGKKAIPSTYSSGEDKIVAAVGEVSPLLESLLNVGDELVILGTQDVTDVPYLELIQMIKTNPRPLMIGFSCSNP